MWCTQISVQLEIIFALLLERVSTCITIEINERYISLIIIFFNVDFLN